MGEPIPNVEMQAGQVARLALKVKNMKKAFKTAEKNYFEAVNEYKAARRKLEAELKQVDGGVYEEREKEDGEEI